MELAEWIGCAPGAPKSKTPSLRTTVTAVLTLLWVTRLD